MKKVLSTIIVAITLTLGSHFLFDSFKVIKQATNVVGAPGNVIADLWTCALAEILFFICSVVFFVLAMVKIFGKKDENGGVEMAVVSLFCLMAEQTVAGFALADYYKTGGNTDASGAAIAVSIVALASAILLLLGGIEKIPFKGRKVCGIVGTSLATLMYLIACFGLGGLGVLAVVNVVIGLAACILGVIVVSAQTKPVAPVE